MLSELTPQQFDEWRAADELDCVIGNEKLYAVLALMAASLVNSWGGKTTPEDFIPQHEPQPETESKETERGPERMMSPNQQAALFRMHAAALGWM